MSIHDEIMGATIFFTPKLDFLFDGDGATVQRNKSAEGVTARDILTIEMTRKAYISDCYAHAVSPGEVPGYGDEPENGLWRSEIVAALGQPA